MVPREFEAEGTHGWVCGVVAGRDEGHGAEGLR
jgi:hypothetical protein